MNAILHNNKDAVKRLLVVDSSTPFPRIASSDVKSIIHFATTNHGITPLYVAAGVCVVCTYTELVVAELLHFM